MSMQEAFEAQKSKIARQVLDAAERVELRATELDGSLATAVRFDDAGAMWLYQPGATVMLRPSQQAELMKRIAVMVLTAQTKGALS